MLARPLPHPAHRHDHGPGVTQRHHVGAGPRGPEQPPGQGAHVVPVVARPGRPGRVPGGQQHHRDLGRGQRARPQVGDRVRVGLQLLAAGRLGGLGGVLVQDLGVQAPRQEVVALEEGDQGGGAQAVQPGQDLLAHRVQVPGAAGGLRGGALAGGIHQDQAGDLVGVLRGEHPHQQPAVGVPHEDRPARRQVGQDGVQVRHVVPGGAPSTCQGRLPQARPVVDDDGKARCRQGSGHPAPQDPGQAQPRLQQDGTPRVRQRTVSRRGRQVDDGVEPAPPCATPTGASRPGPTVGARRGGQADRDPDVVVLRGSTWQTERTHKDSVSRPPGRALGLRAVQGVPVSDTLPPARGRV